MIRANKGGPFSAIVNAYVRRKVRRAFRAIWTTGALPSGEAPLLVYCNHTSFWDGFIAHQLCEAAKLDGYCLMEEANLSRYRFLARIGAFSVKRDDPRSTLPTLRYTRELLQRDRAAVFFFPEGDIRPFGQWPLQLRPGLQLFARSTGALCLPIAIRYAFFEDELPDVLVSPGTPHAFQSLEHAQAELEVRARSLADLRSVEGLTPVVRGSRGVAQIWDSVRGYKEALP